MITAQAAGEHPSLHWEVICHLAGEMRFLRHLLECGCDTYPFQERQLHISTAFLAYMAKQAMYAESQQDCERSIAKKAPHYHPEG